MGYEMLIGPEDAETESHYFGSGVDVADLTKWLAGQDAAKYPLVVAFAEDLQTTDPDAFASQLADAAAEAELEPHIRALIDEVYGTAFGLDSGTLFRIAS
jgi:hypothetical protein